MESDAVNRELIERARGGDQVALGELLEKYRRYLWGLADRMLDDRAAARIDASDVVQQTCLSVHKQITEFDGHDDAQFAAWLRQIHERNIRNAARELASRRQAGHRSGATSRRCRGPRGPPNHGQPARRSQRGIGPTRPSHRPASSGRTRGTAATLSGRRIDGRDRDRDGADQRCSRVADEAGHGEPPAAPG